MKITLRKIKILLIVGLIVGIAAAMAYLAYSGNLQLQVRYGTHYF